MRREFLTEQQNHTGYSQVLQETEFDAAGNPTEKVVYTIGHDQISQTRYLASGTSWGEDSIAYFGTDGHGSVRVVYDASAAIVQAAEIPQIYHFDAYGNLLNFAAGTQPVTSYLYSGEAFDFTIGQQYLRARWYDPTTGRFNRLDPFFGNQSDPQSFHKYAYVHGDPVNGVDPTGMFLGLAFGVGLEMMLPGPGDFIIGGLQALVQAYVVNLEWDIEWAQDLSLPDSWGSRLDNSWVYSALGAGMHNAMWIGIPFTDIGFNPLDAVAARGLRGPSGGVSRAFFRGAYMARHAITTTINYAKDAATKARTLSAQVNFFYHRKLDQYIVRFPDYVKAAKVKLRNPSAPTAGKTWEQLSKQEKRELNFQDLLKATEELKRQNGGKLPNGMSEVGDQNGVPNGQLWVGDQPHTWHHSHRKGELELIPTQLHKESIKQVGPHIGQALWWKSLD